MKKLFDSFSWGSISAFMKVVAMLFFNKTAAVTFGPSGYLFVGNFQNFAQIAQNLSLLATNNSLVSSVAREDDLNSQDKAIGTALTIVLIASMVVSAACLFLSDTLADLIFNDLSKAFLLKIYSLALIFNCLFHIYMSKVNGLRLAHIYGFFNITSSVVLLLLCVLMLVSGYETLVIISIGVYPAVSFLILVCLPRKYTLINIPKSLFTIDSHYLGIVKSFAAMAVISAVSVPVCQYIVRNMIAESISIDVAGGWEAMMRLSGAYLIVIMATFNLYFLPAFSKIESTFDFNKERWNGIRLLVPLYIVGAVFLYLFAKPIISALFTEQFYDLVIPFLGWFLMADLIKTFGLFYVYLMFAKTMTLRFCISEVFASVNLVTLIYIAVNYKISIGAAYCCHMAIYLFFLRFLTNKNKVFSQNEIN